MLKRSILLFVVLIALLVIVTPVSAFQAPIILYVDTAYVGSEEGTNPDKPYNTMAEAVAVARNSPGGGLIMIKSGENYVPDRFVDPVRPGQTGLPIAGPILYIILAVLSLVLTLSGWLLGRRSRRLKRTA